MLVKPVLKILIISIAIITAGCTSNPDRVHDGRLIDHGFRVERVNPDAKPIVVTGPEAERIDSLFNPSDYPSEQDYLADLAAYLSHEKLVLFTEKFPQKQRRGLVEQYLCKRNSEEILKDGFYIGCQDIAVVTSAVLSYRGYNYFFIIAVCEDFSERNDCGHVLMYISKDNLNILFDPSSGYSINYTPGQSQVALKFTGKDYFVFAVTGNPREYGIYDLESLKDKRRKAYADWGL